MQIPDPGTKSRSLQKTKVADDNEIHTSGRFSSIDDIGYVIQKVCRQNAIQRLEHTDHSHSSVSDVSIYNYTDTRSLALSRNC